MTSDTRAVDSEPDIQTATGASHMTGSVTCVDDRGYPAHHRIVRPKDGLGESDKVARTQAAVSVLVIARVRGQIGDDKMIDLLHTEQSQPQQSVTAALTAR